jgi:hypothetical protein
MAIHCLLKLSHRGKVELETMPLNKSWSKLQENITSALASSLSSDPSRAIKKILNCLNRTDVMLKR